DLVEPYSDVAASEREGIEAGLGARPSRTYRVVAKLVRKTIDRLPDRRPHGLADARVAAEVVAPGRLIRPAQQRRRKERPERQRDVGMAAQRRGDFGAPRCRCSGDVQSVSLCRGIEFVIYDPA